MTDQPDPLIISLPPEPAVGTVVEIVDGENAGDRYRRETESWSRQIQYDHRWVSGYSWSSIWSAVTADNGGGTTLRVIPPDPHPLPWRVIGTTDVAIADARGAVVCDIPGDDPRPDRVEQRHAVAAGIVAAVNKTGGPR